MLPVSTDTQWHRGYAWVHLRKAWTVWNHGGNNNLIPSKNIYKRNCTQFRESVIIHIDEGLTTRCIIPVETGLCNIQGEKENIQMYICLLSWDGNVDGHARRLRHTGPPTRVCPFSWFDFFSFFFLDLRSFMTPTLCDKSQHQTGDSFMTSFTLHFQLWASFWWGL